MKPKHHFRSISYLDHNEELYDKLFTDLQNKLDNEKNSGLTDQFFLSAPKSPPSKQLYAEELKKQIEAKNKTKVQEKLEQKAPAINENFNGYPNLPITPRDEKRRKLMESMFNIKHSLDQQVFNKHCLETDSKIKELELDRRMKDDNLDRFAHEIQLKREQKSKQKEILTESWNLAIKAKDLQSKLEQAERKGSSLLRDTKPAKLVKQNTSAVGQLLDQSDIGQNPVQVSRTRPVKLKQPLPGKGYQAKIKKIITNAKQLRESHIKAFPPHASP